jgi:hypothetical protein
LWAFCLGCPRTMILLISASHVARIMGMTHWCLAHFYFYFIFLRQGLTM